MSTLIRRSSAMHLIYQSSIQLQVLHWAGPSSTVLRMRAWNPTKERAFIPLTYWRLFAFSLSLSVLWLFGPYSGHGFPIFLPPILFSAADFHFHTWSRASASFSTLFSHLLRDLPTSLLPPKLPLKNPLWNAMVLQIYNVTCQLESLYSDVCWKRNILLHPLQLCILSDSPQPLLVGRSKYFSEDFPFKGISFIHGLFRESSWFTTINHNTTSEVLYNVTRNLQFMSWHFNK